MGDTNTGLSRLGPNVGWLACSALRDTGVRATECKSGKQVARNHAGMREWRRGKRKPTMRSLTLRTKCRRLWQSCARYAQRMSMAGMVCWCAERNGLGLERAIQVESWRADLRRDLARRVIFLEMRLVASLIPLSQPPTFIYLAEASARWPGSKQGFPRSPGLGRTWKEGGGAAWPGPPANWPHHATQVRFQAQRRVQLRVQPGTAQETSPNIRNGNHCVKPLRPCRT